MSFPLYRIIEEGSHFHFLYAVVIVHPLGQFSRPFTTISFVLNRKRLASPEDVEYFEYQQELHEEILDEYKIVERIIGKMLKLNKQRSVLKYLA